MRAIARRPLLILAITAAICARTMFALFDDPEGPNLLVVAVMTAIIFLPSAGLYLSRLRPALAGTARVLATIVLQLVATAAFYLALR